MNPINWIDPYEIALFRLFEAREEIHHVFIILKGGKNIRGK
jgi:hypothetical protein